MRKSKKKHELKEYLIRAQKFFQQLTTNN